MRKIGSDLEGLEFHLEVVSHQLWGELMQGNLQIQVRLQIQSLLQIIFDCFLGTHLQGLYSSIWRSFSISSWFS